jgi:hypothetical protein
MARDDLSIATCNKNAGKFPDSSYPGKTDFLELVIVFGEFKIKAGPDKSGPA